MTLDPTITFIIVLIIGIAAGIITQRVAPPSWLARQIAGRGRADLTSALVGIAGAFIGFHIAAITALSAGMLVLFIAAAIGAMEYAGQRAFPQPSDFESPLKARAEVPRYIKTACSSTSRGRWRWISCRPPAAHHSAPQASSGPAATRPQDGAAPRMRSR